MNLNGDHERVRECFYPDEPLVLCAKNAPFKVGEVIELAKFFGFVRIVEMSDKPV